MTKISITDYTNSINFILQVYKFKPIDIHMGTDSLKLTNHASSMGGLNFLTDEILVQNTVFRETSLFTG